MANEPRSHYTREGTFNDRGGWWEAICDCGAKLGVFPDAEEACDALMQHAYEQGVLDGRRDV